MERKNKKVILTALLLFTFFAFSGSYAQVSIGGVPMSFFFKNFNSNIAEVRMPAVDTQKLMAEDRAVIGLPDMPYRFGSAIDVSYNLHNSGTWDVLSDGSRIWRLNIKSQDALSIYMIFNNFYLPEGAKLFVYNPSKSTIFGAFTSMNNREDRKFAVAPFPDKELILEYYEPKAVAGEGVLEISKLIHGYKDILGYTTASIESLPCEININCPIGAPWLEQKRSVTRITFVQGGSSYLCSGAMINNTTGNRTQYFLTAEHCAPDDHASMVFYFNYEASSCSGTTGPTNQTVSGAQLKASNYDTDFRLVLIQSPIPGSYNIFYSGWDRSGTQPTNETSIHHPGGDIKKISVDYNPAVSASASGFSGPPRLTNGFWRVIWDQGMTEGGSSGSPMYDQNKRIIGQNLGGVAADCANPQTVLKYFGKFSDSWSHGGNSTNQLKDWLDPTNTGATTLDGIDGAAGLPPTPNFSSDFETLPYGGGTVNFTDLTTNLPTGWSWSFPGGTPSSSTERNPTGISYSAIGRYTVSLTATNSNGSNTVTKTGYITVSGVTLNTFNLYFPSNNGRIEVGRNDLTPVSFTWGTSNPHPTVKYKFKIRKLAAGTQDISFTSNNNGADTLISLRRSLLDSLASTLGTTGDSVQTVWRAWAYNGLDSSSSSQAFILTLRRTGVGINQISTVIPENYKVYNNFPNPFNPSTTIKFDIARLQDVKIAIYDLTGKEVARLAEQRFNAGTYELVWDAKNSPSGIYFLRFESDEFNTTKRLSLVK